MKKSECWLSFTIFSTLLFQISVSQGSTFDSQDGDCVIYQRCGETSASLLVYEQNFTPSLKNNGLIQTRDGNSPESLTWTTEVPKMMESSGTENFLETERGNLDSSKENIISNVKNSKKNFVWNVVAPQVQFLSKSRPETTQITQGMSDSKNMLAKTTRLSSKYSPAWSNSLPKYASISRSKRKATHKALGKVNTLFGLQASEEVFHADHSLEALLKKIIVDHIYGCDLIIVYDQSYRETRTLEALVNIPFTKQVLQLVSLEDLSDLIEWESQNCQGTMLLVSEPDILINFGEINRFFWAYRAKVIIVGLELHSLEKFLKTVKGRKTEHIIGVVEDPINQNFEVYMNLLFWGEGMKLMTDWSDNTFSRRTNLFPDKVNDLRKAELNVLCFEFRPQSIYEYAPDRTVIARHGRYIPIVRTLAKKLNFTINFIDIADDWGLLLENGSFNGLVGHLQRDEGHIGLPFLYMSALDDRHIEQDHAHFIEDDRLCFLVRREAPRPAWQSLGLPFTRETWIAIISGIILFGPIFHLFIMASTIIGEEYKNFQSLAYSSLFTIGIQIDSPLGSMPKLTCNRVFIVFLLLYSLILSTGYTSNLISFLTVARPPHQINTFKDLAESGLTLNALPWMKLSLELSGNPYLRQVAKRFEPRFTMEEALDEFLEGEVFVLNSKMMMEGHSTLMKTKSGKPLTRFIKECITSYTVTIAYQWHAPVNPRFDEVIARLVESGIARRWASELNEDYKKLVQKEGGLTYYPDVWHEDKDGLIPLSNSHLTGLWAVLVLGYFFAIVSFGVEVIGHKAIPLRRTFDK